MNDKKRLTERRPGRGSDALDEVIRVDHAGEFGAVRIYEGQLAVFERRQDASDTAAVISEMADQEAKHLETFDRLVLERRVRPTALAPVWHAAGYALGVATALMGPRAAMACTVAVEEVIDEHYAQQIAQEKVQADSELAAALSSFREDELQHRDIALSHDAEAAPGYALLSAAIKTACRTAIKLSEKI